MTAKRSAVRLRLSVGAALTVLMVAGCARSTGEGAPPSSDAPSASTTASSASTTASPASGTAQSASIHESAGSSTAQSSSITALPSSDVPVADVPLRGTTWYFIQRNNNDLLIDQPADPDAWVRFSDDSLTFNGTVDRSPGDFDSPCPTWTPQVRVGQDEVELTGASRSDEGSRLICGARFLSNGAGPATLVLQGRTLSIHLDQGPNQSTLVFSADPPAAPTVTEPDLSFLPAPTARTAREVLDANPLRGRNFRAESITGRTIVGKGATMKFGVDQVGLNAGCNGGGAGYTVDGDTITFTAGPWSGMLCGDERVMAQESWLNSLTAGAARFSLAGSRLTLTQGKTQVVLSETPATDPPASNSLVVTTIDEIVDGTGHHPLPELEPGQFWSQAPSILLSGKRLVFDAGCGQYVADFTGSLPDVTVPVADGAILHDCPPNRSALAAALRSILSGPVTIERDGAFVTFTGRNGLQVTAHSGYENN